MGEFVLVDIADNRRVKQLIVLGNGFDLTCGLKSQYEDFYSSVKDNFNNILVDYAFGTKLKNPNWTDVESNLLDLLNSFASYYKGVYDGDVAMLFDLLDNLSSKYRSRGDLEEHIRDQKLENLPIAFSLMKEEVKEFEKRLAIYLKSQILIGNYYRNSRKLAVSLCLAEYRNDLLCAYEGSRTEKYAERKRLMQTGEYIADFFSFNYTPVYKGANPHQIQNIHGNIDGNNTILGIDGHEAEDDLLEFTKTYRLLSHSQVTERIDLSQRFHCIKFFGHSLGEADYSYFQSIFDGLDLYNAKTKLFFYFEVYDPEKRTEIISNNYHAVSKLLKHYGETFKSNPDHGKNLMHKLILEGRLTVKELDCSLLDK